jgi:hypothetical protein
MRQQKPSEPQFSQGVASERGRYGNQTNKIYELEKCSTHPDADSTLLKGGKTQTERMHQDDVPTAGVQLVLALPCALMNAWVLPMLLLLLLLLAGALCEFVAPSKQSYVRRMHGSLARTKKCSTRDLAYLTASDMQTAS